MFKIGDINKHHIHNYTGIQFYAKRVTDKYLTSLNHKFINNCAKSTFVFL